MFHFLRGLTLAAMTLALAAPALLQPQRYQSPKEPPAAPSGSPATPVEVTTTGEMLVNAEWFDLIFRDAARARNEAPQPSLERPRRTGGTYRTLCVRLCDGFYFPISYSTGRQRFAIDAKQCEQMCPARSRLFVHRNPGADVDDMVDLQGRPYSSLPTAFLHRTQYVADCTCRAHPWEEDALAKHRAYAEVAKQKIAGKTAVKPAAARSERYAAQRPVGAQ
jgi:hypothetical protein